MSDVDKDFNEEGQEEENDHFETILDNTKIGAENYILVKKSIKRLVRLTQGVISVEEVYHMKFMPTKKKKGFIVINDDLSFVMQRGIVQNLPKLVIIKGTAKQSSFFKCPVASNNFNNG